MWKYLVFLLFVLPVSGAPKLPPYKFNLTEDTIVGVWNYSYSYRLGICEFRSDGTYYNKFNDCGFYWFGWWTLKGNIITLDEQSTNENGIVTDPTRSTRYYWKISLDQYPKLNIKSAIENGDFCTDVILSNKK